MSEQTTPLRDRLIQDLTCKVLELPRNGRMMLEFELGPRSAEIVADAALAVIAAQPRPEMAEISRAIAAYRRIRPYGGEDSDAYLDRFNACWENMIALIERAIAVPPGMRLVPADVLERVLDSHDRRCGDDADIDALRALLPERGDE